MAGVQIWFLPAELRPGMAARNPQYFWHLLSESTGYGMCLCSVYSAVRLFVYI